jgi:hypothetical protein
MANENQDRSAAPGGPGGPGAGGDDESALQEELRRESKEGEELVGDTAHDRNVSGSSTWITLPEDEQADGRDETQDGGSAR